MQHTSHHTHQRKHGHNGIQRHIMSYPLKKIRQQRLPALNVFRRRPVSSLSLLTLGLGILSYSCWFAWHRLKK